MNVNEIVAVTLGILIIGMTLTSLDFGLTVAVTLGTRTNSDNFKDLLAGVYWNLKPNFTN